MPAMFGHITAFALLFTPFIALAQTPPPELEAGPDIVLTEPKHRAPWWTPPSNALNFAQHKVAGWRVLTWRDPAGDRIVVLQRWTPKFSIIYERWYLGHGVIDRATITNTICQNGDPVWQEGAPEPGMGAIRAALIAHLTWCDVPADAAGRMLRGFERAFPLAAEQGRIAAAAARAD